MSLQSQLNAVLCSPLNFRIFSGRRLHAPAKVLTVSQPVKACSLGTAAEAGSPRAFEMLDMSVYIIQVWLPCF